MKDVKIDIRVNRDEGMYIKTEGTGEDTGKSVALTELNVAGNISVEHEKSLRKMLCDMIMSAPTKVD